MIRDYLSAPFLLPSALVGLAGAVLWLYLGKTARVATAVLGVPLGGFCALVGDHRGIATGTMMMLSVLGALTAALLSPFNATRAGGKAVLATTGMAWVGFLGVALVLQLAWDWF